MSRESRLVCMCAATIAIVACGGQARINFAPRAGATHQPKDTDCEIRVFTDGRPDTPFVELGTINYHHERHRASAENLRLEVALPEMKRRACAAGADALVDVRVTDEKRLEWAMFHVAATAIRFEKR